MTKISRALAVVFCLIIALSNVSFTLCADSLSGIEESFDISAGVYRQTFADGRQFTSSVPNGGQTYDGVVLDVPSDISAFLTYDGKAVSFKNKQPIYGNGYYVLRVSAPSVISGENCSAMFTFRIAGNVPYGAYNKRFGCPYIACVNTVTNGGGLNRFTFPNHKAFYSSLDGYNTTVEQAVFSFPVNLGYELLKNGSKVRITDNTPITQPGSYTLYVYAKNYGATKAYEAVYGTALSFIIPDNTPVDDVRSLQHTVQTARAAVTTTIEPVTETTTDNITQDSLSEIFNETAQLYKETFSSGDGFYTNTSNGGLVGGNVYIDIPSNMDVTMLKDGVQTAFVNKTYIDEQGTYVLNITDNFQNKRYLARYSFRIQKGVESAADAPIAETEGEKVTQPDGGIRADTATDSEKPSAYYDVNYTYNEDRAMYEYGIGTETFYTNMPAGMFSNEGLIIDVPSSLTWTVKKDGEDYEPNSRISESGSYEIEVRDLSGNLVTLGFYLYENPVNFMDEYSAPKGYSIVSVSYDDYKELYGGKTAEEDTTEPETAEKSDKIVLDQNYEEETTESVTELSSEDAEALELAAEAERGLKAVDKQCRTAMEKGLSSLSMPVDGRYTLVLTAKDMPQLTTTITVDTTAPEISFEGLDDKMQSTGNRITVTCEDAEVSMMLYNASGDEKLLSEKGGSVSIDGVGDYALVAVDKAGNKSEYNFKLVRHIGASGVGAIIMFVMLLAALVAFVIYNKRKLSVR